MKKYPKIRLFLFVPLLLSTVYWTLLQLSISTKFSYEFFPITLLIIGSILFLLNRKLTDYISFSCFISTIGGYVPYVFNSCVNMNGYSDCIQAFFFSGDTLIILSISFPLIYLIINFIKNIGKK